MYKLHLLQHPDWHRTGTSYCYFYIFEIIHHDIVFLFFSKIIPSFFVDKASFHCTHWHRFFPLKKVFFYLSVSPARKDFFSKTYPSFLTVKEGSTSHLGLLPLREEEGNRPTRCSEPLRSKVGGPSKVFAILCGMGPP